LGLLQHYQASEDFRLLADSTAAIRAVVEQRNAVEVAKKLFPGDEAVPYLLRASSAPASTNVDHWAQQLSRDTAGDFIGTLVPSAAAKLISAGLRLSLDGLNTVSIPSRTTAKPATDVPWTAQGAPIAARQFSLTSVTLGPVHKLALLIGLTREAAQFAGMSSARGWYGLRDRAARVRVRLRPRAESVRLFRNGNPFRYVTAADLDTGHTGHCCRAREVGFPARPHNRPLHHGCGLDNETKWNGGFHDRREVAWTMTHPSIEKARALLANREQQELEFALWSAEHADELEDAALETLKAKTRRNLW
jgi:hypothetical protein